MNKNENVIWILSTDIGSTNFAFCIEEVNISKLEGIKNIPKNQRYNLDGTNTYEFSKILEDIYSSGKTILIRNLNLKVGTTKEYEIFNNMFTQLNEYKEYFDKVDYILIEKQLKINHKACRLSICCVSYFVFKYQSEKNIIEFGSMYKTHILGCEKRMKNGKKIDKPARKKWCISTCASILSLREDCEIIEELYSQKKTDDISDTICQLQAFKYMHFVDKAI